MVLIERKVVDILHKADNFVDSQISPVLKEKMDYWLNPHFHGRKLLQKVLPLFFPHEVIPPDSDVFDKIAENIRRGRGTIICLTHFDKGEVPSLAGMFAERLDDGILASGVKVVIAAADHQRKAAILGCLGDLKIVWIVNEDTIRFEEEKRQKLERRQGLIFHWRKQKQGQRESKRKRLGMGLREFIIKAKEAVKDKNGGLIFLALQAGRRATLGEPVGTLSLLLKHMEKDEHDLDYDLLVIGSALRDQVWETIEKPGESKQVKTWKPVSTYIGRDGYNVGSLHLFRLGPIVSREELMAQLHGDLDKADQWAFGIIRQFGLVDEIYL